MEQDDLENLYRSWDDEKLLAAFQNRKDYTEVALNAMQTVITERHLGNEVESILEEEVQDEIAFQQNLAEQQTAYEADILGENISAKELVKKCLIASPVYCNRELTNNRTLALRIVLFGFSIAGITSFIVALGVGMPLFDAPIYFLIPSIPLLIIGIKLSVDSKCHLKFSKEGRKDILVIQHKGFNFTATVPFTYFVFWTKIENRHGRIKITHPMLSLVVTNQNNESISLQGHLTALQDAPPLWQEGDNSLVPDGTKFFTESGFKRSEIIRLKKIIDGLHEIHNERSVG